MTEKMNRMIAVIDKYDIALGNSDFYKRHYAPNIPDKIMKKLIKRFDSRIPANSIVAYIDTTLIGSGRTGYVFTSDGLYNHFVEKPVYIQYSEIKKMEYVDDGLNIYINDSDDSYIRLIEGLNMKTLQTVINQMIEIDKEFGQYTVKPSGKVKK